MQYLLERRRRARRPPAAPRRACSKPLATPRRRGLRRVRRAARGGPGGLDHHGLRQAAAQPAPRPGHRASASCPSSPTRRAPSAWTRSSRRSASTPRCGQLYEPVDSKLILSYREASDGQVLEEGITEAGSTASFAGRRHVVRHARRADDPLLHLLLDVRLPAHRRPVLGVRATPAAAASCWAPPPAAPRSTARACSTRTATAWCSPRASPSVPRLRPGLRLRDGGHHPRRPRRGCTAPSRRTSSTTSRSTTRTTSCRRGRTASRDEDIVRGLYRFRGGSRPGAQRRRARPSWPPASSCSRRWRRRRSWPSVRRRGGRLERTVVPAAAQRGPGGRALEPAPPAATPRVPHVTQRAGRAGGRRADRRGLATGSRPGRT